MVDKKTVWVGILMLVLFASGIVYVSMGDDVRIRVDSDKSVFYTKLLDDSGNRVGNWRISGVEYNKLFDGSSQMNRNLQLGIPIETIITETDVTITRTTTYIRGPVIVDTYYFKGNVTDVELFPISHTVEIYNGTGYFYRYEVRDLDYEGDTRKLDGQTNLDFGMNMKVSLAPDYRWAWVYKSGIVKAQYDINSDYEVFNVRLFDPLYTVEKVIREIDTGIPIINETTGNETGENETYSKGYYILNYRDVTLETPTSTICEWNASNPNRICTHEFTIINNNSDFRLTWNRIKKLVKFQHPENVDLPELELVTQLGSIKAKNLQSYLSNNVITIKENKSYDFSIVFDYPVGANDEWNLTFNHPIDDTDMLIDPEISACSKIVAGGVYTMTGDIIDSTTSQCINISVNDVVLDCQGHTIDGNGAADYGIQIGRGVTQTTNVTIKNCIVTDWDFAGIWNDHSKGNIFNNLTVNSNADHGIYLFLSNDCIFTNVTTNSNPDYGIYLYSSDNINFTDVTSNTNGDYGINMHESDYVNFTNCNFINNSLYDVYYTTPRVNNDCHNSFTNVNGTDNKPILFYNSSVTIDGWDNNVSEIILCGADDSVINNVNMSSVDVENNGIILTATENTNISNFNGTDLERGIYLYYSDSNKLTNITANLNVKGIRLLFSNYLNLTNIISTSNTDDGIETFGVNYCNFTDLTITSNTDDGLYIDGNNNIIRDSVISSQSGAGDKGIHIDDDNNIIENVTISSNYYGIYLDASGDNNTMVNCTINANTNQGIYMNNPAFNNPNIIYNNLFNNTNNIFFIGTSRVGFWNTTNQTGTRIYGDGTNIGGNYWTNGAGTGYSDECADTNTDGFCDSPLNLTNTVACSGASCNVNSTDYLPLSDAYGVVGCSDDGDCELCYQCVAEECVVQADDEDLKEECDTVDNCGNGLCNGAGACDWLTSGTGNCAECNTCVGATSESCVALDNVEDATCNGLCVACQSGTCGVADASTDPDDDCAVENCNTGECKGTTAECAWETTGEGQCVECKTCQGATSVTCLDIANDAQDSEGSNTCVAECETCDGSGSCIAQDYGEDLFTQCTASGDCNTGSCKGTTKECGWLDTGEGDCAACGTCDSASSLTCINIGDDTEDDEGSNLCGDCKNCNGAGSCINQGSTEDLFSYCGIIQCDSDASPSYYHGWTTLTCYYRDDVTAADAVCDGSGVCKTAATLCPAEGQDGTTGVSCEEEGLQIGCTGTTEGSCAECDSNDDCNACYKCDGGSCVVQTDGEDLKSECGTTDCYEGNCDGAGACDVVADGQEGACAACYDCDGADSTCDTIASNTQDQIGSNTCQSTCEACFAGSCTSATVDTDPGSNCTAENCKTGNCDGSGDCKIYADEEEGLCVACEECNGVSESCVNIADHTQDDTGDNKCIDTCKECDGAGSCENQAVDQDYFTQCDIVQCDGDAGTPYYYGWDSLTCYYRLDVTADDAKCDGSAACKVATDYCGSTGQDGSSGVTCACAGAESDCSATTIGSCDNTGCPPSLNFSNNINVDVTAELGDVNITVKCYYSGDTNNDTESSNSTSIINNTGNNTITNPANTHDEDWATYGWFYTVNNSHLELYLYENFTNIMDSNVSTMFKYNYTNTSIGLGNYTVYCLNQTNTSDLEYVYNATLNDTITTTTISRYLPNICYEDTNYEIGIVHYINLTTNNTGNATNFTLFETNLTFYNNTVCVTINDTEYGTQYVCDVNETSFIFHPTYFRRSQLNDTNTSKNLTYTPGNQTVYIDAHAYDEVVNLTINLTGYNVSTAFPSVVRIYINDTLSNSIGYLYNTSNITTTLFNNSVDHVNFTLGEDDVQIAYLKLPKEATVTGSAFNVSIGTGWTETEYSDSYSSSYSCTYTCNPIEEYGVDGDWNTGYSVTSTAYSYEYVDIYFYETYNYNVSWEENLQIIWKWRGTYYNGTAFRTSNSILYAYIWNYTSGSYQEIQKTLILGPKSQRFTETHTYNITVEEWKINSTNPMLFKVHLDGYSSSSSPFSYTTSVTYYESKILSNATAIEVGVDVGTYDGSYEFYHNTSTDFENRTIDVSTQINGYLGGCDDDANGDCYVPIYVDATYPLAVSLKNLEINYTYNPNPIELNITLVKEHLNNSNGFATLPINISSDTNGVIQISDIQYDYLGGNESFNVTSYQKSTPTNYINNTIQFFYSNWNYSLPSGIEEIAYYPWSPTAKNVTPFGQSSSTPILNITSRAYNTPGHNFSITLNETFGCVNITASNSSTKTGGSQLTTNWNGLYTSLDTDDTFGIWLWSDLGCSYTTWYSWSPNYHFRACVTGANICDNSTS